MSAALRARLGCTALYQDVQDLAFAVLQHARPDRLVGHVDTTLGEHILDVLVAQSEAEIEPDGLLDDDTRKTVATV